MTEVISEAREFISKVRKDENLHNQPYGHALSMVATILTDQADMNYSEEKQRQFLRERALELIKKFGPNILQKMREDYKLALTDEDLGLSSK